MKEFRNPHIVELYDLQKSGKFIYLVMEYCEGGDLASLLRRKRILAESEVASMIRQLGQALGVLFEANYAHRDLKPQNLLLCKDDTILKLGDFGFARFVDPADLAETLCGSPLYMAPEILRYEKYDGKADLWSVGAIMYEMLFGRPPYRAQNHIQLLKVIEASGDLEFPPTAYVSDADPEHEVRLSESCKDLLVGLLKKNPDKRLSFDQFITHPFLDAASPTPTHSPIQPLRMAGFTIPKSRSRSTSSGSIALSLKDRRSSLSQSLKQQEKLQSQSMQSPTPLIVEHPEFLEEDELARLLAGFKIERPGLSTILEENLKLANVLKDIARENMSFAEQSPGKSKIILESLQCLVAAAELFLHTLALVKDSAKPSDDGARALVLWIWRNIRFVNEKCEVCTHSLESTSMLPGTSVASSSGALEAPSSISSLLYGKALTFARDGGLRELRKQWQSASRYYQRSLFLLELLATGKLNSAIPEDNASKLSAHDTRVVQGYVNTVKQRLRVVMTKGSDN